MTHRVQIRPAEAHDAEAIASVLREAFAEFEPLYTREGFSATTPAVGQILARMNEGPVWVACHDEMIQGTVAAVLNSDFLYMRGMGVRRCARGSGVASQLLLQVEDYAAQHGCARIVLSTTPFLHAAIRFYEKHGFRRSDEGPQDLLGTPLLTMEKELRLNHNPANSLKALY